MDSNHSVFTAGYFKTASPHPRPSTASSEPVDQTALIGVYLDLESTHFADQFDLNDCLGRKAKNSPEFAR